MVKKFKESWKNVKGFEGLYKISNKGRVKALTKVLKHVSKNGLVTLRVVKEKILKPNLDGRGYYHVRLSKNGKVTLFKIHDLVAIHWLRL